eukprot:TRINITY_DN86973_c0_g1_i1.p1 TRINITY_DN86973_c0_g1~~TRINITY_DN86973_c0_g1_i1.p1  ORF type:complete len:234 (+),score=22.53 TRINITY_DN86973_c0_g1_i1:26-703(+)
MPKLQLFLWVALALCDVPRPLLPPAFITVQVSTCLHTSIFCPPGFENVITSNSYYDSSVELMSADDLYDRSSNSAFISDQTYVNRSTSLPDHLTTYLYHLAPQDITMKCFQTTVPGTFFPRDFLSNATFIGQELFNGRQCNKFLFSTAIGGSFWFVSVDTQEFVGTLTSDGSQEAVFYNWRSYNASLPSRAWVHPTSSCPVLDSQLHRDFYRRRFATGFFALRFV